MGDFLVWLGVVAALGATCTKVVDLVRNATDEDNVAPKWVWNVVALAVGLGMCLGWQIDVTAAAIKLVPALASARLDGVAGQAVSGLIVGGASGFFHEFFDLLSSKAKSYRTA